MQIFFHAACSWFGCETDTKCVHGLWSHSLESFLDFLVAHQFNAIRLPFTAELALDLDGKGNFPTGINFWENKALEVRQNCTTHSFLIHNYAVHA